MLIIFLFISVFSNTTVNNINLNYDRNYLNANAYFFNNPKIAIDYYNKVLKVKANPLVYAKIADCYKRLGDIEKAKDNYNKAIEVESVKKIDDSDLYYRYSLFLFETKDYENALKYIDIAILIQNNASYLVLKKNITVKQASVLENNEDEEIIENDEEDWITEKDLETDSYNSTTIFRGISASTLFQDRVLENGLEDASEFDKSLFLELDHQYTKTTKIVISTRLYWRLLLERNEGDEAYYILNNENAKSIFDYALEESYIDYKKGKISFRLGQQYFKWGENTAFSRSDIINPIDIRDSIIPELDRRKIAVFALNAGYTIGDKSKLTLAWIPFRYNPKISYWGRDFAIIQPSKDIDTSIINKFISPTIEDDLQSLGMTAEDQKKNLVDSSVAINLSSSIKSLNLSFVYYYGFQEMPEISLDNDLKKMLLYLLAGETSEAVLGPIASSLANKYIMGQDIAKSKFTRYNHLSFSASLPISDFIVKLDASYSPRKLYYSDLDTSNSDDSAENSFNPIYKKVVNYTLGLEYQFSGDKLLVDIEYFGSSILDDKGEDYFYDRKTRMGIFSLIKWNIIKEHYSLTVLGNYNFFFKDYLFTIRATKHLGKLSFSAGYNHFGGDMDTPIGRYTKNDEFFLSTKYYF